MCGILGVATQPDMGMTGERLGNILRDLYLLSESRGKESAGLHLCVPEARQAWTVKHAGPASQLLRTADYRRILTVGLAAACDAQPSGMLEQAVIAVGHSRLVTNGLASVPENNQPVRRNGLTVVHNGIVVNAEQLWREHTALQRQGQVDTEIIASLLARSMDEQFDPMAATRAVYQSLRGAASLAWVHEESASLILSSNTGDVYYSLFSNQRGLVFASEEFILRAALERNPPSHSDEGTHYGTTRQLRPGSGLYLTLDASQPVIEFELFAEQPRNGEMPAPRYSSVATQHDVVVGATTTKERASTAGPARAGHLLTTLR